MINSNILLVILAQKKGITTEKVLGKTDIYSTLPIHSAVSGGNIQVMMVDNMGYSLSSSIVQAPQIISYIFLKEDFIRKSTKTKLITKYIHICTSHHQLHIQTLYIIQNEVLTMDIKHLSNRQLSWKVVQLIYVDCPRTMQIYLVYTLELLWDYTTIVWYAGQISY